jgi:organic hydroperoxide reductase OsmC/OhrA
MARSIEYRSALEWIGNKGSGTSSYEAYSRDYVIRVEGKPDLAGSAGSHFRGTPDRNDPEDHFIAAISGCHMLSYLALAARHGVVVTSYVDNATGTLQLEGGGGYFSGVTLRPVVTITPESDGDLALSLHEKAHEQCFIANSVKVEIRCEPEVRLKPE